jgi:hypothetical protein
MNVVHDDDVVRLRDISTGYLFIESINKVKPLLNDALTRREKEIYFYFQLENGRTWTVICNVEESLKTIKAIEK